MSMSWERSLMFMLVDPECPIIARIAPRRLLSMHEQRIMVGSWFAVCVAPSGGPSTLHRIVFSLLEVGDVRGQTLFIFIRDCIVLRSHRLFSRNDPHTIILN